MLKTREACTDLTTVSTKLDDTNSKLQAVISVIRRDIVAADLKWSLFVAASQSYRHDSCLRPFPPMFLIDSSKDFVSLVETLESIPALSQLESLSHTLLKTAVQLLYWVLVELKEPSLSVVDNSEMGAVLDLVPSELSAPSPSLLVSLHYNSFSTGELRLAEAKQQYKSVYAFHGSKVDNFHSILHHGLQQHLTKNALFGQGVYLSSELLVCLPYSRNGLGWSHSSIGSELSIVALCEVVDHPSVHCQTQGNCENKSRARANDSIAGEVPHKLYLVPNSDLVRVRHLLVYVVHPTSIVHQSLNQRNYGPRAWLSQHKMTAFLFAYGMMLMSIGLSRSSMFSHLWRDICHLIGIHN